MKQILLLTIISVSLVMSAVNDIFPTDYVPNKSGDIVATLYLKESQGNGYYKNGSTLMDDSANVSTKALRVGYTTEILGYTSTIIGVAAHGKTTFEGALVESLYPKSTSGMGDFRLGITSWLVNDYRNMRYLALTYLVSVPTGEYDSSKAVNIGENRYKNVFSAGYIDRVVNNEAGELFVELLPELVIYGDNDNARGKKIEQKSSYALTGYLRYRPIPIMGLFTGYQINRGGESSINGIRQNDQPENTRFMLGGAVFAFGTQIVLRHAKDTYISNGFKAGSETTLRLQWNFR